MNINNITLTSPGGLQQGVDEYFRSTEEYWDSIYREHDLVSMIYQYRQAVALKMVEELALPRYSSILEVGSGAGVLTLALARRDYRVTAIDRFKATVDLVSHRAQRWGVQGNIDVAMGDVHELGYGDGAFDLVIGLGVIPWLHSPERAAREMARVTKRGGYVLLTADNRWRLNHILDPRFHPTLTPLRKRVKSFLEKTGLRRPTFQPMLPIMHSTIELDAMLASVGLTKVFGTTVGFGPFTFMGKRFLPDALGKIVNRLFQIASSRNVSGIRSTGNHYVVLAQRIEQDPGRPSEYPKTFLKVWSNERLAKY